MTKVIVEPDESFENALKRFKKSCEKAGLMSELRKRQHYEKPSVKRKRKMREARKRRRREAKRRGDENRKQLEKAGIRQAPVIGSV